MIQFETYPSISITYSKNNQFKKSIQSKANNFKTTVDGLITKEAQAWFFEMPIKLHYSHYIIIMNQNRVTLLLQESNLGLNHKMVQEIQQFIQQHIGNLSHIQNDYEIFAAAAIIGQVMTISDVSKIKNTRSGIFVEGVMRHIGKLSKEEFLEVLTRQVQKWREAPSWLKNKIDKVKISYRIYKKYRTLFEQLCKQLNSIDDQTMFNLMSIFWILYLFLKKTSDDDMTRDVSLMHGMFIFIFSEVMAQIQVDEISRVFKIYFPDSEAPNKHLYQSMKQMCQSKMQQIYSWRYENGTMYLQQLVSNQNFMQRYLDDISNLYDRFKLQQSCTFDKYIDQISYLQLVKTLTPLTVKRNPEVGAINKKINFFQDDQLEFDCEDDPNHNIMLEESNAEANVFGSITKSQSSYGPTRSCSPIRNVGLCPQNGGMSPVLSRHTNLVWLNNILKNQQKGWQTQINHLQQIFQLYVKHDFKSYEKRVLQKIMNSIAEFTPSCMDFYVRQRSIYYFSVHFINRIAQSHKQQEKKSIFSSSTSIDSIICLSTNIFNFAYHSLQSSYKKYCDYFQITLLDGHKPINWFGLNVEMPKIIQTYLYDLEKKVLILQIWQDSTGYDIINQTQPLLYHIQAIKKRLMNHVDERTQDLCNCMKIQECQIAKIINLIRYIINNRQILLKKHNIDQIIVCCIASILSINRSQNERSLQQIFSKYNTLSFSYNAYKQSLYDNDGNQMSLVEWYNCIFLMVLEDILNRDQKINNILNTPIRLERKRSRELDQQMTPLTVKFKQTQGAFGVKRFKRDSAEELPSYRSRIVNSLKNLNIQEKQQNDEQNDEDCPSPQFANLKAPSLLPKNFSFGDLNSPKF